MKTINILLTGLITVLILCHISCSQDDETDTPPATYSNGEGEIGSSGGSISVTDQSSPIFGASISIPEGALSNSINIRIIPAAYVKFPLDSSLLPVLFEPEGLTFYKPIKVTLPFGGRDIQNAAIYYYNETDLIVSELAFISKDAARKTVTGQTDHFSCFVAADKLFAGELNMVYCQENNRIGAIFHVLGWYDNDSQRGGLSPGLSRIPILDAQTPIYGVTAEEVCKNNLLSVHAVLEMDLYKNEGVGSPESSRTIRLVRDKQDEVYFVKTMDENENSQIYQTSAILYDGNDGLEAWYMGEPLVFYFNEYDIDLTANYSVKAKWQLAAGPEEDPDLPLTYNFEINNNTNGKKPDEMDDIDPEDIYENSILTDYVEEDYGQPCPGVPTVNYAGKTYRTVQIGNQCWMKENLDVGTMINGNLDMSDNYVIEKYCYGNDPTNCDKYGGLYQWNEMMMYVGILGGQGICPDGWHVPTDHDWRTLEGFVDSEYEIGSSEWNKIGIRGKDAGVHLKSKTLWIGINYDDKYGFSALPAGIRNTYVGDVFSWLGTNAIFWTSMTNSDNEVNAWYHFLDLDEDGIGRGNLWKKEGLSVRCIMD